MVWIDGVVLSMPIMNLVKIVIQWAKKTGDYSVLSHADLCVLALTYALDQEYKKFLDQTASIYLMNIAIEMIFLIAGNK